MRLQLDPMPALREEATRRINERFAGIATANAHRDHVHARKRADAQIVADGGAPSELLSAEAEMRGVAVHELAALIVSKPDTVAARELERQRIMLAVDRAASKDELAALLGGAWDDRR